MLYRSRRTTGFAMLLSIILGILLTACGGSGSGTTGNTGNGSCSSVQLTYWNALSGPDGPVMQQVVTQFNSSHPNSQVKMTIISLNDYATKLDTAAASNTLPDIAIINEDQIATQAFRHVIRPMDSIMPQLGYTSSDFAPRAWSQGEIASHRYGVPLFINPLTMFYNADLLSKAGVSSPPTDATSFANAAAAVTKGSNHGFQITTGFPVQQIFQQLLHQFGGSEFNSDVTQATWNSAAGVQALQWMKDAQSKYSAPKLPVDGDVNSFKAGTVGIIWNGIWQSSNVTGDAVDFKGMAAATPQIGSQPATWAGMGSLALPYHKQGVDKCKDAASATFIKYVIDNSYKMAQGGDMPAYHTARNNASVQAIPLMHALSTAVDTPVFPPPTPGISDAFAPLSDAVGAVMAGTTTNISKALSDAATRADQILSQNRQKYGTAPTNS